MAQIDKAKEFEEILKKELGVTDDDILVANRLLRLFILVQGIDWEQKPYWAYMAIPPGKITEFQAARAAGDNALVNYGEVLKFGYGIEPSDEIKKEMTTVYGMQHDFVDTIEKELKVSEEKKKVVDKYAGKKDKKEDDKK